MVIKTIGEIVDLNEDGTFSAERINTGDRIIGTFIKSVLGKNIFAITFNTQDKEFIVYYNFKEKKYFGSIFNFSKNYGNLLE